MPTNHDVVAAVPPTGSGQVNKTLLRNLLAGRYAYVLAAAEDSRNLVVVDPATGVVTPVLVQNGRVYDYDPADSTTLHDGVSCLVSSENKRYKLASGTDVAAYSVISAAVTAPPGSPSLGDTYRVPAGATGAWSGHTDDIAIYTARGWEFVTLPVGRVIYNKALTAFEHRAVAGWTAGLGSITISDGSLSPSVLKNVSLGSILKVENQTTNAPPGSPADGVAYIIGGSPTGAWAGKAGWLALYGSAWNYKQPVAGDMAYDKSQGVNVSFNGTAWETTAGVCVAFRSTSATDNSGLTNSSGTAYNWLTSPTTPPSASTNSRAIESLTISHTAKKVGNLLRLRYVFDGYGDWNLAPTFALMRDSESAPLEYRPVIDYGASGSFLIEFMISATDVISHTYKIMIFGTSTTIGGLNALTYVYNRRLTLEEFVQ